MLLHTLIIRGMSRRQGISRRWTMHLGARQRCSLTHHSTRGRGLGDLRAEGNVAQYGQMQSTADARTMYTL